MNRRNFFIFTTLLFGTLAICRAEEFPLSVTTQDFPHIQKIRDGQIKIPECRISYSTLTLTELQRRFDNNSAGDVIEVDFATYLKRYSAEEIHDWILVPVFPWRDFPQRHLCVYNVSSSTGVMSIDTYNETMMLWAKGVYESSPTIQTAHLIWEVSRSTHLGMCAPVFPDALGAEQNYFRETRIFPIMTVLAVRAELVKANPWLPEAIFIAFAQAKSDALEAEAIPLPWGEEHREDTLSLMKKNYWSYGVKNNPKTLQALFKFAAGEGILSKELHPEDVFAPETIQLIDEHGAKN